MKSLRRLSLTLSVLLATSALAATPTLHEATPLEVLLERYHAQHSHAAPVEAPAAAPTPSQPVEALAARTFNVTAARFNFTFSPSPAVVNQGDVVTLNISASDNGDGAGHGFFLEQYATSGEQVTPGEPITIQFTANTPGTFTFFCTIICGSGHGSMSGVFTVVAADPDPPTIASFNPTSGPTGGGNNVVITGTNFRTGAVVDFGATRSTDVFVSSATQINVTAPAHAAGDVAIKVTNTDSTSDTSSGKYTYIAPGPHIASIDPSSAPTVGPTEFTINGSGFVQGATVAIGDITLPPVMAVSSSIIRGAVSLGPSDLTGDSPRDVIVTNPDGLSDRLEGGFTWLLGTPAIRTIAPVTGPTNGGTSVTINGSGLSSATGLIVAFDGVPATGVTVVNAATITVLTPPHAEGVVDVTLTASNGTTTSVGAFTYSGDRQPRRRAVRH